MSGQEKVSFSTLVRKKRHGHPITMLTAYDFPLARFINMAGIDIVLVSDALATVGLGRSEVTSVTVDEMIYHTRACRRGAGMSLLLTTLPFGSYVTPGDAVQSATRIMKEGGGEGIHLEGTFRDALTVKAIVDAGIPVLAHVGIIKQKILRGGTFRIQGRTAAEAAEVVKDSMAMADAGAFALVLECIPSALAEAVTRAVTIPTIGIGAGNTCDGQALVTQDMLGLYKELSPRFLRVYADLESTIVNALSAFREDVERRRFPGPEHTYVISDDELSQLLTLLAVESQHQAIDLATLKKTPV